MPTAGPQAGKSLIAPRAENLEKCYICSYPTRNGGRNIHPLQIKISGALHGSREAITILEVIISIVVATIGVLGIMVMIPFAIKQTETGLALDDAHRLLENGIAQFEIEGHDLVVNGQRTWVNDAGLLTEFAAYAIDPLSIHANGLNYDRFPSSRSIETFGDLRFPEIGEINLMIDGQPMGLARARQMFMTSDDLVFRDDTGELAPPEPSYDVDSSGSPIRRQSRGGTSWMALVVPRKEDPRSLPPQYSDGFRHTGAWKYQMHCLAWKTRALDASTSVMPIAEVIPPNSLRPTRQMLRSGGTITLKTSIAEVRRNDWVMLVNEDPDLEIGFQLQIAFYRVIGTGNESSANGKLTLEGPDFDFRVGRTRTIPTFVVHLANYELSSLSQGKPRRQGHVINVFERTLAAPKSGSNWTP